MGSIAQFPWYRAFWPRMGVDEPANLLVWREQLARLMLTYGAIVLPLSMIYILPVFVSEKRYSHSHRRSILGFHDLPGVRLPVSFKD